MAQAYDPVNMIIMIINQDYGCTGDWNFFETAHGKGPVDGIGGQVKNIGAIRVGVFPVTRSSRRALLEDALP